MDGAIRLAIAAGFAAMPLLWVGSAQAASFDCSKAASRIEHLVCDDPDLNSLDSQLQGAYLGALDRSNHPLDVKQKQLAWLRQRDDCADRSCMAVAYRRQIKLLSAISDEPPRCGGSTTVEIDSCALEYSHRADRELARYLAAARNRLTDEAKQAPTPQAPKTALADLDVSQTAWEAYRKAECNAVYDWWSEGTIRGAMYQSCWLEVTEARTEHVWSTWLRFMDSTPPLLPDPTKH
ncbi:lysozyme inhibitor LprI family protein [Phenylobacterium sp.]|uniref:lysozyme inhibitor LprI family protein n=1 Tax=Phenylobacterium sp. TaxID=1871053 RepID=UPI002E35A243|nr:lysozyme inhibitor LprI family protein [Phenylobacterium sp.]HEX3363436.1 lysozyme inhibitor LprI family protein [Phenylobacterium sp.]